MTVRVQNGTILYKIKRGQEMLELTIKNLLFNIVYYPTYLIGIILTAGDFRYWILTTFLIVTGSIRFYRWMRRDDKNNELKQVQIDRERLANEEKEVELLERRQRIG